MAKPKRLKAQLSPEAVLDLELVTSWNITNNGFEQAVRYRDFLMTGISQLETSYERSRKVRARPDLRFIVLRWSPKGHGHIVVFKIDEVSETINIARLYHTSQNWENHARKNI